jgi:hypothetical protein
LLPPMNSFAPGRACRNATCLTGKHRRCHQLTGNSFANRLKLRNKAR